MVWWQLLLLVVSYGGYWLQPRAFVSSSCEAGRISALAVLSVGVSSSCEAGRISALVVQRVVESNSRGAGCVSPLLVLIVVESSLCEARRRAENGCVKALENPDKLWIALEALRVESQLVNCVDQYCAMLVRS